MLTLTEEQLDWLCERAPDAPVNPKGGRPPMDKHDALRGIFCQESCDFFQLTTLAIVPRRLLSDDRHA